jgi:hypothetical protein
MVPRCNKHADDHTDRAEQPLFAGRSLWEVVRSARRRNALINEYHWFVGG